MKVLPVAKREITEARKNLKKALALLEKGGKKEVASGIFNLGNIAERLKNLRVIDHGPALDAVLKALESFENPGIRDYDQGSFNNTPGTWITAEVFVPFKEGKKKEKIAK